MSDTSSPDTRVSLLASLREVRNAAAWNESWKTFVATYAPLVYRYARRRGLQDADAADVTQEVLTETARCLRTFEYQPERGRFRDWLGTLTRRQLTRFFAKQQRDVSRTGGTAAQEMLEGLAAPQPEAEWTDTFHTQLLRTALDRIQPHFAPPTWQAFAQVWLHQRTAAEAAADLDLPIDAIYLAKSRVLKRLREELLHLAEDLPQCVPLD
jgi:RNA polymerase sigma-70 factor (ECF subfamily)